MTDSAEADVHTDWFPSWSPDGATIVFKREFPRRNGRSWAPPWSDARGRNQHRLTRELTGDACCPSWGP